MGDSRAIKTKKVGPKSFSRWLLSSRTAGGQHVTKSLLSFPTDFFSVLAKRTLQLRERGRHIRRGETLRISPMCQDKFYPTTATSSSSSLPSFINNSGLCLLGGGLSRGRAEAQAMNARVRAIMRGGVWCDDCRVIWFRLFFVLIACLRLGADFAAWRSKALCTLYTYVNHDERVQCFV